MDYGVIKIINIINKESTATGPLLDQKKGLDIGGKNCVEVNLKCLISISNVGTLRI